MEEDKGTVCVTGGTGYIASWLIMKLLQRGFCVRTTVRFHPATESKKDISYLTNLPEATNKLQIFKADLNNPDTFTSAIQGCIGVFHLAHPMDLDTEETEQVVTKRAGEGALGVLKACLSSKTVKKVVYTSSAAAVLFNNKGLSVADENTWSDVDVCRSNKLVSSSYLVSKTVTEKMVLEFGEKYGLDVVTLVLPVVLGPFICPSLPSSVGLGLAMIFGYQDQYKYLIDSKMVHIEDVARAQIFLLENPIAKGRYICSSSQLTIHQMYDFLSQRYPQFQLPFTDHLKGTKVYKRCDLSSKKLLDSGFKFKYGLNELFDEAIQCCKEEGFLN